eukprot:1816337-Amphidinium_carterae.1
MDHSGSAYLQDILAMEDMSLLAPGAVILADNVLKPGAPRFLSHVCDALADGSYSTTLVTVPEFSQPSIEDWMSVSMFLRRRRALTCPSVMFDELAWRSDMMRRRSERGDVTVSEWSAYSRELVQTYDKLGLGAIPWQ